VDIKMRKNGSSAGTSDVVRLQAVVVFVLTILYFDFLPSHMLLLSVLYSTIFRLKESVIAPRQRYVSLDDP
jgi:hypothetical protein